MDIDYLQIIDTLAKEYGWTVEYIQSLSMSEINGLIEKINERKIAEWNINCYIFNCAFTGKKPNFKRNLDKETQDKDESESLIKLMNSLGAKVEKISKE